MNIKQKLADLIHAALSSLQTQRKLADENAFDVQIEYSRDPKYGDFACNIALILAKKIGQAPRELAEVILTALQQDVQHKALLADIQIAGPGFINFYLQPQVFRQNVLDILQQKVDYGCQPASQQSINIEYISANPTGPLHVGHGRSAAYGSSVANLLKTQGYSVKQEYYVNDAGRQMAILALSVWLRYLELYTNTVEFPENAYRGEYIKSIARDAKAKFAERFVPVKAPIEHDESMDPELHIDALIAHMRESLVPEAYETLSVFTRDAILDDIKNDCGEFRIHYDTWFSEKSLFSDQQVEAAIEALSNAGYTYQKEGALWFNAIHFGDEKDRVLRRANGQLTYFASDAAYVRNKFERGFNRLIYIFGADHHGYVPRLRAVVKALGYDDSKIDIPIVQFATLYREGKRVQMSTRSGSFVTLRELREEVGNDAARYFYVMRKAEQHMDFDLDLAKSQSSDNPVYYIQYAHARICSVLRQAKEKNISWDEKVNLDTLARLDNTHEQALLSELVRYSEVLAHAANAYEPHHLAQYLREVANQLHAYYNAHAFLVDDDQLRNARLALVRVVQQIIANGLQLLGVNAPESM